jgi:hypothetical protein
MAAGNDGQHPAALVGKPYATVRAMGLGMGDHAVDAVPMVVPRGRKCLGHGISLSVTVLHLLPIPVQIPICPSKTVPDPYTGAEPTRTENNP